MVMKILGIWKRIPAKAFSLLLAIILWQSPPVSASGLTDSLVLAGNQFYLGREYSRAIDCYTRVISLGYEGSSLFYNLGNAYFKQNDMPRAILYYEKARILDPGDDDIRQNLAIANSRIVDKIDSIPDFFLKRWISGLADSLSSDRWALLSVILFALSLAALFVYNVGRGYRIRKMSFWAGMILLALSLTGLIMMQNRKQNIRQSNSAIIMTPVVNVKSSPDEQGTSVFMLHEGTRVMLMDSVQHWKEVKIPDGNKGWVPDSVLAVI